MLFRIGRHRHLNVGDALDAGHQIGGVLVAAGMRRVFLADAGGRIAAQRHDVAHARLAIGVDDGIDLGLGRGDAGEMRSRHQRGFADEPPHRRMRALARRTTRAIGHRDEIGTERCKPADRLPETLFHLIGLRREELERNTDRRSHHATSRTLVLAN
jgi:hypothetical protein